MRRSKPQYNQKVPYVFHFGLGNYALQILRFLLFITETKPFPFSRFSVLKTDDSVQGGTGISATGAPIPDYGQYDRPTILRNKKKNLEESWQKKGLVPHQIY